MSPHGSVCTSCAFASAMYITQVTVIYQKLDLRPISLSHLPCITHLSDVVNFNIYCDSVMINYSICPDILMYFEQTVVANIDLFLFLLLFSLLLVA
jgi:hypothetical protein